MIIYEINCHSIKNNPIPSAPLPKVMVQRLRQTISSNWRLNDSTDTAGPFNRTLHLSFTSCHCFTNNLIPYHFLITTQRSKRVTFTFHLPPADSPKLIFWDDSGPVAPTLPTPKAPHGWGPLWLWNHVRLLTLSFVVLSLTSLIMVHQHTAAAIKGVPCIYMYI